MMSQLDIPPEIVLAAEINAFQRCRDEQRLKARGLATAEALSQHCARFRFSARIGERRDDTTDEGSISLRT
jgi:hypothetical protein